MDLSCMKKFFKIELVNHSIFNSKILKDIHVFIAIIIIAWLNIGIFTYILPYVPGYIRYSLYIVWIMLAAFINKQYLQLFIKQSWPLLLFTIYIIAISFIAKLDLTVYIKSITYLIMVYSIFLFYFHDNEIKYQKIPCAFLILDCLAIGINTHIKLATNPLLARYLATGATTKKLLFGTKTLPCIGSYAYIYAVVSIILLMLYLFLNKPRKRYLLIIGIVAGVAIIIEARFTMAILFTFIFIVLILIDKYLKKYKYILLVLLVCLIAIMLLQGTFPLIFQALGSVPGIPNEVSVRFNEISYFLSGNNISGTDLYARLSLYSQSIEAFSRNILTGIVFEDKPIYVAGGHSAWLDLFATFGLVSLLFYMFLYKAYKYTIAKLPSKCISFVKIYWLYYICLGILNTLLFAPIYTIWFLFLPLFINAFCAEE